MRLTLAVLVGGVLITTTTLRSVGAQVPSPSAEFGRFTGSWRLETAEHDGARPERRIITLSPEWLRVEIQRAEDARPPILTYRFDGRDTVNDFGAGKATSRLLRENGAVVTETIYEIRNSPITVRETLSLDPGGTELTVNTTVRVEHGYEGPLAAGESKPPNVSNATMIFRRQP